MASTLTVDNIVGATAAAKVHIPGGVVQLVASSMGHSNVTTSSNSYVTTGLSVTITPKFSTSKIYLTCQGGGHYLPFQSQMANVTIYRGNSNLGGTYGFESAYSTSSNYVITGHSFATYDVSIGTTNAITYTVYMKTAGGTYQFQSSDRATLMFTAMEIAQ
jgi:hypothetical protein